MRRLLAALLLAAFVPALPADAATGGVNDDSCRPTRQHPEPVVVLHGLSANKDEDLNLLQEELARQGYCTFSLTYGAWPDYPWIGGVRPVAEGAAEIAAFVRRVLAVTGTPKVAIVGHSEGGFQSLYVTKTQGVAPHVARVVAIAPPTHGTTFGGLYDLAYVTGQRETARTLLRTITCPACDELGKGGSAVATLEDGPIAQPGVQLTIIQSRYDEMVTPVETAFVHERGVTNTFVQDVCPLDPVGHLGEAYDTNVWHLVENALDPAHAKPFACSAGAPA